MAERGIATEADAGRYIREIVRSRMAAQGQAAVAELA
jgi:hypothetical protein